MLKSDTTTVSTFGNPLLPCSFTHHLIHVLVLERVDHPFHHYDVSAQLGQLQVARLHLALDVDLAGQQAAAEELDELHVHQVELHPAWF